MTEQETIKILERRLNALEGKLRSVDEIAQNVVKIQETEKELQQRLQFEELITSISTKFINLLPSEIDSGINLSLEKIGELVEADRCYVFQFSDNGTTMKNTHEYCAKGVKSQKVQLSKVPLADYPWAIEQLREKGILHVLGVDDFPEIAANEKRMFQEEKVQAYTVYAIHFKDRLGGFVGFDWLRAGGGYSEKVGSLLQVAGVIFANALERQRVEMGREQLIAGLQESQEKLLTLSVKDQLTGLFNRRHMEESLTREISRSKRHGTALAIIMLDVDHFKAVNDEYGHIAGDVVLQKIGNMLKSCSRGEDVACRYGGEEFVVIMPGADLKSGERRAEELCHMVRSALQVKYRHKQLPPITISLGVASYPDHGKDTESLINEADSAMYEAKRAGRDTVRIAQTQQ